MNIFLIPSWYPSKQNPTAGLFIKEQAKAIGKFSNCPVIISLWGSDTKINFEKPKQALPSLINFFQDKSFQRKIAPQVFEFNEPVLEWSARFSKGNINSIIKANITNFEKAQEKFGKVNLIHAHVSFPAGYVAMKLAQEFKIPYVITEHMGPFPLLPFSNHSHLMPLVLEPLKKADLVIAVSSKLQTELFKYKIKSKVVPNLIDDSYQKYFPQKVSSNFNFFSLGEISKEKGFEDLIKAIALALKKDKNLIFRLGGQGKYLKKYQRLAQALKIDQNIKWLGVLNRQEVLKELQHCNAFVLPSYHESFGMVFLEALACGRPVIATACGGPEDFVTKENGLLVEKGNIELIASAMVKIKENIKNYPPVKIHSEILKKYSSSAVSKKLFALYKSLV
ncbi:MAG: glycosyltransferase [Patescibacteria group bacterium]|nr:glycosyltransferase [Patescibacteria group bacterium]